MPLHFSFSLYSQWLLICFATLENPYSKADTFVAFDWFRSMGLDQWRNVINKVKNENQRILTAFEYKNITANGFF